MRSFLAGLILFSVAALSLAPVARGQATGQVLGIGFDNFYRPDGWVPLRVQLHSDSNDARNYMIQVHQQDLDKDTIVYSRVVALSPKPSITDYWVYFVPQPTDNGLPDGDPKALGEVLKVYLYDEAGKNLITTLPITFPANSIDPPIRMGSRGRGQKLILAVTGEHDRPSWGEYRGALGLMEGVQFVNVSAEELPDNVLGYQSVDAIIWFDAQAKEITQGGSGAGNAIKQWVQQGGQLVICQPDERGKIKAFADAGMLPVEVTDAAGNWLDDFKSQPKKDLQPLYFLARNQRLQGQIQLGSLRTADPGVTARDTDRNWERVIATKQDFGIWRAKPKPDAVIDQWVYWDGSLDATEEQWTVGFDSTPFIARRAYGMGSVTWVAQDLGSPRLVSVADKKDPSKAWPTGGWPYVWDRVFGWKNETIILDDYDHTKQSGDEGRKVNHPEFSLDAPAVELGQPLLKGLDASARGVWLVTVAIFFFIIYWIVAGPGSYLFLASKGRKGLSWTVFAVAALVATVITVGVVKLVLRGDPEVHHVTIMRLTPGDPAADGSPRFNATAISRFGLYIPRDGDQTVELTDASTSVPSYVTALELHPIQMPDEAGFTDTARYDIATDNFTTGNVSARFPFRSTLKKIQTEWNGTVAEGITGSVQLINTYSIHDPADIKHPESKNLNIGPLKGILTNSTGRDLHDVYFAFPWTRDPTGSAAWALYVHSWPKGAPIDLDAAWRSAQFVSTDPDRERLPNHADAMGVPYVLKGQINELLGWGRFWLREDLSTSSMTEVTKVDDADKHYVHSFPLMAFFEQVGPYRGEKSASSNDYPRAELLRHGGRALDVAPLLASGRMVILAQADGAVPYPLKINGNKTDGDGVTLYEISLPLDNKTDSEKVIPPTTAPTNAPK